MTCVLKEYEVKNKNGKGVMITAKNEDFIRPSPITCTVSTMYVMCMRMALCMHRNLCMALIPL